jgi:hypothetical protein
MVWAGGMYLVVIGGGVEGAVRGVVSAKTRSISSNASPMIVCSAQSTSNVDATAKIDQYRHHGEDKYQIIESCMHKLVHMYSHLPVPLSDQRSQQIHCIRFGVVSR